MKAVYALAALAAVVAAQESSSPTVSLSPQSSCSAACPKGDICCQAGCAGVPCPDEGQANDTTECAAKCDQGDGSQSDTEKYASCQQSCISSLFLTATATRAAPTAPSAPSVSSPSGPAVTSSAGSSPSESGVQSSGESKPTGSESASPSGSASPTDSDSGDDDDDSSEPTSTDSEDAESTGDNDSAAVKLSVGTSALGVMTFILAALAF